MTFDTLCEERRLPRVTPATGRSLLNHSPQTHNGLTARRESWQATTRLFDRSKSHAESPRPSVRVRHSARHVRAELVSQGVEVGQVFHDAGGVFLHDGTKGNVASIIRTSRPFIPCSFANNGEGK